MNQSTNFVGQHLFGQVTTLCSRSILGPVIRETKANRYYKRLHYYEHFISMLYCTLSGCTSLREISAGLGIAQGKLNHLGIEYVPPRSTLSDGNRGRPSAIFKKTYEYLYKLYKPSLSDSTLPKAIVQKLFLLDAKVFSLFKAILKTTGRYSANGRMKGGIKKNTIIEASSMMPYFIQFDAAADHYQLIYKNLSLPAGSPTAIMKEEVILQTYEDESKAEQTLRLRRIAWWDADKGRAFEFITNDFELEAITVAQLYKYRW